MVPRAFDALQMPNIRRLHRCSAERWNRKSSKERVARTLWQSAFIGVHQRQIKLNLLRLDRHHTGLQPPHPAQPTVVIASLSAYVFQNFWMRKDQEVLFL